MLDHPNRLLLTIAKSIDSPNYSKVVGEVAKDLLGVLVPFEVGAQAWSSLVLSVASQVG